jgi:hypothetical protein
MNLTKAALAQLTRAFAVIQIVRRLHQINITTLVDAFVEKVNVQPREPMPFDDVPEFLRADLPEAPIPDNWAGWRILKRDNSVFIESRQRKLGKRFPPSCLYFVSNYSFPAFEFGPLMFFGNQGEDDFWELGRRLFANPNMSPVCWNGGSFKLLNHSSITR